MCNISYILYFFIPHNKKKKIIEYNYVKDTSKPLFKEEFCILIFVE